MKDGKQGDLNPPDVLSDTPAREPESVKTLYDRRPGHISMASDRANFGGCRMVAFGAGVASGLEGDDAMRFEDQIKKAREEDENFDDSIVDTVNLYFKHRANLLVINEPLLAEDAIILTITNQLDEDDLEEFQEVQRRVNLEMREWRAERSKLQEKQAEQAREVRRLMELGKKAEDHNLFEKLRRLEEENAELKRGKP